jgi:hypothetical protein
LVGVAAPIVNDLPAIPRPAAPGLLPDVVAVVAPVKAVDRTIAQLKRLKESFDKENGGQAVPPPLTLPPTESANVKLVSATDEKAVYKPMHSANSPWSLQVEMLGEQKLLIARLNERTEFRITCDNIMRKTLNGAAVAMGKVSFTGPGLKGSCSRLTLGLVGDSLVLEGKAEVQIQQGGAADAFVELKGEQFTLRLQPPAVGLTPVQPLTVTPAQPLTVTPATPMPVEVSPFQILSPRPGPAPLGGQDTPSTGTGK